MKKLAHYITYSDVLRQIAEKEKFFNFDITFIDNPFQTGKIMFIDNPFQTGKIMFIENPFQTGKILFITSSSS